MSSRSSLASKGLYGEEVIWRSGWFWLIVAFVLILFVVYLASTQLKVGGSY